MKQEIISQFLYKEKLRFSEIEKNTKIRSNKLAYYIKNLTRKGILIKEGETYRLSDNFESIIPYISEKQAILPVVLVMIKKDKKVFMYQREKRPYLEKLSLPGGRILLGEDMEKATLRIMKKKFDIECKFEKVNSVSIENVVKKKKVVHSFLLILVTASTKDKIPFIDIEKSKNQIIKSDYFLIKEFSSAETSIEKINSVTN